MTDLSSTQLVLSVTIVLATLTSAEYLLAEYAPTHDDYKPAQYHFSYGVSDPITGDHKHHWETREGDSVRGEYGLLQPDGVTRIVEYTADSVHGFRAKVHKIGQAHHPVVTTTGHALYGHDYHSGGLYATQDAAPQPLPLDHSLHSVHYGRVQPIVDAHVSLPHTLVAAPYSLDHHQGQLELTQGGHHLVDGLQLSQGGHHLDGLHLSQGGQSGIGSLHLSKGGHHIAQSAIDGLHLSQGGHHLDGLQLSQGGHHLNELQLSQGGHHLDGLQLSQGAQSGVGSLSKGENHQGQLDVGSLHLSQGGQSGSLHLSKGENHQAQLGVGTLLLSQGGHHLAQSDVGGLPLSHHVALQHHGNDHQEILLQQNPFASQGQVHANLGDLFQGHAVGVSEQNSKLGGASLIGGGGHDSRYHQSGSDNVGGGGGKAVSVNTQVHHGEGGYSSMSVEHLPNGHLADDHVGELKGAFNVELSKGYDHQNGGFNVELLKGYQQQDNKEQERGHFITSQVGQVDNYQGNSGHGNVHLSIGGLEGNYHNAQQLPLYPQQQYQEQQELYHHQQHQLQQQQQQEQQKEIQQHQQEQQKVLEHQLQQQQQHQQEQQHQLQQQQHQQEQQQQHQLQQQHQQEHQQEQQYQHQLQQQQHQQEQQEQQQYQLQQQEHQQEEQYQQLLLQLQKQQGQHHFQQQQPDQQVNYEQLFLEQYRKNQEQSYTPIQQQALNYQTKSELPNSDHVEAPKYGTLPGYDQSQNVELTHERLLKPKVLPNFSPLLAQGYQLDQGQLSIQNQGAESYQVDKAPVELTPCDEKKIQQSKAAAFNPFLQLLNLLKGKGAPKLAQPIAEAQFRNLQSDRAEYTTGYQGQPKVAELFYPEGEVTQREVVVLGEDGQYQNRLLYKRQDSVAKPSSGLAALRSLFDTLMKPKVRTRSLKPADYPIGPLKDFTGTLPREGDTIWQAGDPTAPKEPEQLVRQLNETCLYMRFNETAKATGNPEPEELIRSINVTCENLQDEAVKNLTSGLDINKYCGYCFDPAYIAQIALLREEQEKDAAEPTIESPRYLQDYPLDSLYKDESYQPSSNQQNRVNLYPEIFYDENGDALRRSLVKRYAGAY